MFHDQKLTMIDITQVLEEFDTVVIPSHEKDTTAETVSDKYSYTRHVVFGKAAPE